MKNETSVVVLHSLSLYSKLTSFFIVNSPSHGSRRAQFGNSGARGHGRSSPQRVQDPQTGWETNTRMDAVKVPQGPKGMSACCE